MLHYNENDLCSNIENIEKLYRDYITDDEVWEIAREFEQIPIMENIYQNLLFDRLQAQIIEDIKDKIKEDKETLIDLIVDFEEKNNCELITVEQNELLDEQIEEYINHFERNTNIEDYFEIYINSCCSSITFNKDFYEEEGSDYIDICDEESYNDIVNGCSLKILKDLVSDFVELSNDKVDLAPSYYVENELQEILSEKKEQNLKNN